MTKKEFEERTGRTITPEDYRMVEILYMASGEMDKDEFCKELKAMCAWYGATDRIELRRCLNEIATYISARDAGLIKRVTDKKKEDLAEFLIEKAEMYDDPELYQEATELIGEAACVCIKIRKGMPLWEEDTDYLLKELSKKD